MCSKVLVMCLCQSSFIFCNISPMLLFRLIMFWNCTSLYCIIFWSDNSSSIFSYLASSTIKAESQWVTKLMKNVHFAWTRWIWQINNWSHVNVDMRWTSKVLEYHCVVQTICLMFFHGLYLFWCISYLLFANTLLNNCKTTLS